ncbi:MAG TPA: flagellin [Planctomycetaceae bacterium]|nr:flagellin [Planctomycetaceae bacterium]
MTRINTNVGSLIAQTTLARNNGTLSVALQRLSTGLRINTAKDDPAGLIASEALRSNLTSVDRAIGNSERANQVIATADSAIGQVSKLLNDIRGLIVEGANEGALSDDQISANQLQIDSSLEAINRISRTTTFQGRRLLDGSLDFLSTIDTVSTVSDLEVTQANLGTAGKISVDVDITAAAAKAEITNTGFSAATQATATLRFAPEAILTGFTDAASEVTVRATEAGTKYEGIDVSFVTGSTAVGSEYAVYDEDAKTIQVYINNTAATTAANVATAINALAEFEASATGAGAIDGSDANDAAVTDTTDADEIAITAASSGPDFNNLKISVVTDSGTAAGSPTAAYDPSANTLVLTVNDASDTTLANAATAINNLAEFSASATTNGDGNIKPTSADIKATANTDTTGGGTLNDDLVINVSGADGSQVFNFKQGASINQVVDSIKLVSDATGVTAIRSNTTLTLQSTAYGSSAFVNVEVISEGSLGTFQDNLSASRASGTDIEATVNGVKANGDGNSLSISTASLSLSLTVDDGSSTNFEFEITGGGALFQLGPDVVSTQQARLGISSLNTATLGGSAGRLYELGTGEAKSLQNDASGAAKIVDQVITKVTRLRGRLGAFQRTAIDTNIASLNDLKVNLSAAESSIRDADFAAESANLTRAQILVQSSTSVLAIANSQPQNVLALLR